jgi:hypothetical protein
LEEKVKGEVKDHFFGLKKKMTFGSILLGLALLGLVGLYIARPLFKPERRRKPRTTEYQTLLIQKEVVLTEIKSLDFDSDTHKLPEAEYNQKREQLMAEATAILKQLDALDESAPVSEPVQVPQDAGPEPVVDDEIEAAITRLRAKPVQVAPAPADGTEAKTANGQSAFCPQCGQATDPDDKFCANCGHELLIAQRV